MRERGRERRRQLEHHCLELAERDDHVTVSLAVDGAGGRAGVAVGRAWIGLARPDASGRDEVRRRIDRRDHPGAGLYAKDATFDYWASGEIHEQAAAAIESVYKGAAGTLDSAKTRLMVAPGVVVGEGMLTAHDGGTVSFPSMSLLAVDGDKVAHEEVFLDPGPDTKKAVTSAGSAPGPKDTAKAASQAAAAVGDAFVAGDQAALRELLAPGVLFYDTELRHGVRGVDAVLVWQSQTPTLELTNQAPIVGPGWAVVRWTVRQTDSTGVQVALPGATVMEVRGGRVVRMTLYYDNAVIGLQE